jgi:hypothetical protein
VGLAEIAGMQTGNRGAILARLDMQEGEERFFFGFESQSPALDDDEKMLLKNQYRPFGRYWLRGLNSSILRPEVAITMRTLRIFSPGRRAVTILQNN